VVQISAVRTRTVLAFLAAASAFPLVIPACVPPGNSTPSDAGTSAKAEPTAPVIRQAPNVMREAFEDNFDRPSSPVPAPAASASAVPVVMHGDKTPAADARSDSPATPPSTPTPAAEEGGAAVAAGPTLGPDWAQAGTTAWRIENGRLCGQNAHNHGVWLQRVLPINARIEFDAISDVTDGDLKAELWGDGRSAATSISYTNATSYLTILGGWHNQFHVLARMNEHGTDRKEIKVDKDSDDPTQKPVTAGQVYHFKIERTDGKTVKWFVNGIEYLDYSDPQPLAGIGHDHFGFNDWEAKVCFDNVKVTPL